MNKQYGSQIIRKISKIEVEISSIASALDESAQLGISRQQRALVISVDANEVWVVIVRRREPGGRRR